jgi:hypothetical protein
VAVGLALGLLLLAPDDPAQLLRVAWASQYEWKEDKVQNVTLDFRYSYSYGETEAKHEGDGQLVVAGDEIVRRHYPELRDESARKSVNAHVQWVLDRFVRKSFEETFKDQTFAGPEQSAFDQKKITAGPRVYFVKDDRLVAEERNIAEAGKPMVVRVDYQTSELGGGYAITGETISYTRPHDAVKVTHERTLTTRMEAERPAPATYTYDEKSTKGRAHMVIEFYSIRFDLPDPVVLNASARDQLKEAWARRFVLPNNIRIQGEFQRSVDKELDRAGWRDAVRGEFQVWGMDSIQVGLDEDYRVGETEKSCTTDISWIFGLLKDTPFDEEFKGCGFELEPQGTETAVRVYGYPKALAFRLAGGTIVGHYDKVLSEWGWWTYKTRAAGEGRVQIDRMKREVEGRKFELEFAYQRARGHQIPKKCDVLEIAPSWRGGTVVGVAEYTFRKPRVSIPDE